MSTFAQYVSFGPYFSDGNLCTLKVYHYVVGTTTLLDMYTDRDKSGTVAQPLTSDSDGIAEAYGDGIYKIRVDGSTDGVNYTTLYTVQKWSIFDFGANPQGEGSAIASASTLTLGTDGNMFHVTGNTGPITAISGNQTMAILVFNSTPTLTYSGNLILQYGVDYVASANNTMTFVNDGGGVWREIARTPAYADIAAKGDLVVGTANDVQAKLSAGSNGAILMARSADSKGLAYVAALNKYIYGFTYANNSGDATNDLDIAAGGCMDATGAYFMVGSALTKQSDANWAVGTGAGGLDTGAVGNSDYYIWCIARSDTGVVDYLYSLSSTAPTMPGGGAYDFKRLIGWFKRVGGTIVAFHTYEVEGGGLEMNWDSPTLDVNLANTLTTARRTDAVKVPLNFSVMAHLNVVFSDVSGASNNWIYCPDQSDLAPSSTAAPLCNGTSITTLGFTGQIRLRTSSTGTVAARSTLATVDLYAVATMGFTWARKN